MYLSNYIAVDAALCHLYVDYINISYFIVQVFEYKRFEMLDKDY